MPTLAGCSFSIDSILQQRPSPEKTSFLGPPQGSAKLGKLVGTSGCCMLHKRLIVELISFSQRLVAGLGTCDWRFGIWEALMMGIITVSRKASLNSDPRTNGTTDQAWPE